MTITKTELDAAIHDLRVLHAATTKGDWQKGDTSHKTVSIFEGKPYHIAEFRHADDAAFIDAAHKYIIPLLDELEAMRKTYLPMAKEYEVKDYVCMQPKAEPASDEAAPVVQEPAKPVRDITEVRKAYAEWFNMPGKEIHFYDTPVGQKCVALAVLASDELRESVAGFAAASSIESRDGLFDYFLRNPNHKHSYFAELKPTIEQPSNNFITSKLCKQYGITGIEIINYDGRYVLVGYIDADAPIGDKTIGVASYVTHNRNPRGTGWSTSINSIFSFYNIEASVAEQMIDDHFATPLGDEIVRHRSIIDYLIAQENQKKTFYMDESIAEAIIKEESNMGFRQQDMMVTGWEFAVWSEPTLVGIEAALYLARIRCKDKKGALKVVEKNEYIDYAQPFGITVEGANSIIEAEKKNGFQLDGVCTGKGGRVWCNEIKSIALLEAVATLIIAELKKEGSTVYRLGDAARDYQNFSNE